MSSETAKVAVPKFPLRLMPSTRHTAEVFSRREGVSLNQFINVAVAEKLSRLQHEEWLRSRKPPESALLDRALQLLEAGGDNPPDAGDTLPAGYQTKQPVRTAARSKRR